MSTELRLKRGFSGRNILFLLFSYIYWLLVCLRCFLKGATVCISRKKFYLRHRSEKVKARRQTVGYMYSSTVHCLHTLSSVLGQNRGFQQSHVDIMTRIQQRHPSTISLTTTSNHTGIQVWKPQVGPLWGGGSIFNAFQGSWSLHHFCDFPGCGTAFWSSEDCVAICSRQA